VNDLIGDVIKESEARIVMSVGELNALADFADGFKKLVKKFQDDCDDVAVVDAAVVDIWSVEGYPIGRLLFSDDGLFVTTVPQPPAGEQNTPTE